MSNLQGIRAIVLGVILTLLPAMGHAAASVLLWPVDPVIGPGQRASALWLENRGEEPVLLQIRIFAWSQRQGVEAHDQQTDVVGTPPMVEVAPGARQLVRLTRTVPVAAGQEHAFRVIIDEVPRPAASEAPDGGTVRFRLRYSIPLFVYGEGLAPPRPGAEAAAAPQLAWRVARADGRDYLEVSNQGRVHARITGALLEQGGVRVNLAEGLLGYVLAGSTMRWPLPEGAQPTGFLAAVNGAAEPRSLPMAR